ncbi:hypothetical protein MKX01_009100 [Papaver californicum]|nr:hypothetical protein MKX01_009100 [Papaver californicum]
MNPIHYAIAIYDQKKITSSMTMKPKDYFHSPIHYAIAIGDHKTLNKLLSTLDVPHREIPLHLVVRLNDTVVVRSLASAGSDVSLQNSAGWNPLLEAVCSSHRNSEIALILLRFHHRAAWSKWRRKLPRLVVVLRRMRDFYMEISFHFESSIVPFVGKIAPSDTYKIWKRDGNLHQSFLFLRDGYSQHSVPSGSLLVLNRDQHKIFDAFENADSSLSESDINGFWEQTFVYRPGMDVRQAHLQPKHMCMHKHEAHQQQKNNRKEILLLAEITKQHK